MFSAKQLSKAIPLPSTKNIKALLHPKNRLSLVCDLTESHGPSSTGKTITIASTGGNKPIGASNAMLGLNLFCKDLASVALNEKTCAPLTQLTPLGPGFEWQVVEQRYLHLLLDFENTEPRITKSEKSTLLLSSGGFKKLGGTGVSLNLNCYCDVDKPIDPQGLATFAEAQLKLPVNVTLNVSDTNVVTVRFDLSAVAEGESSSVTGVEIQEDLYLTTTVKKLRAPAKDSKGIAQRIAIAGSNVTVSGAGSETVTLSFPIEEMGFSSTGKTLLRGSTKGVHDIENVRISLVAYGKREAGDRFAKAVRGALAKLKLSSDVKMSQIYEAVQEATGIKELTDELKEETKSLAKIAFAEAGSAKGQGDSKKRPRSPSPTKEKKAAEAEVGRAEEIEL